MTEIAPPAPAKKPEKIDLHFLLRKYGPPKYKDKPPPPEPKYYDDGFAIEFKLSHAYRALEHQEAETSKVRMRPKPKLTRRAVKKLRATYPTVYPQEEGPKHEVIDRGTIQERVSTDLDKYKEIGRRKRENREAEVVRRRTEEEKEKSAIGCLHKNKPKVRTAAFWRQLMNGKTIRDIVAKEEEEQRDNTFLTTAEPGSLTLNLRRRGRRSRSRSPQGRKGGRAKSRSASRNRLNAVEEWQKRKDKRKQKKQEQNVRVKQNSSRKVYLNKVTKQTKPKPDRSKSPERSKRDQSKTQKVQIITTANSSTTASKTHTITPNPPPMAKKVRPKSAPAFQTLQNIQKSAHSNSESDKPKTTINPSQKHESLVIKHTKRSNTLSISQNPPLLKPELDPTTADQSLTKTHLDTSHTASTHKATTPRPLSARVAAATARSSAGSCDLDEDGEEGEEEPKKKLLHKPTKFLFDMCRCNRVSRKPTINRLQRTKKVGGVIELLTCTGDEQEELCPFCKVLPSRRIQAWLEDVDLKMHL